MGQFLPIKDSKNISKNKSKMQSSTQTSAT